MALVGRSEERKALSGLVAGATAGISGALVLRGEAGVGKTALLDEAVALAFAREMRTLRLTGFESETQLGYAALHRLLVPFMPWLARLPAPQGDALRGAFGLIAGPPADRFLVGLGVLTLLADVASEAPLLCVVDDVQWLDPESAVVLGFVARRLDAEGVVLVFAAREPTYEPWSLTGLAEVSVDGLGDREALALLSSITGGRLNAQVAARVVAEIGGNPLALIELVRELSAGQLAGSSPLPEPLPVGRSLQQAFARQLNRLPLETRLLLALAAAEPTASQALLWRAAELLGVDPEAAASKVGDVVEFTSQVVFRHPMVRSVAYHLIPLPQRREIHRVLANVGDPSKHPDRVAWHLGKGTNGPDEAVAAQLEQAAEGAREHGKYAATATFMSRAAELSVDQALRTRRLLAASEAALVVGQPHRAGALLDQVLAAPTSELQAGTALRLSGEICFATGQLSDAPSRLLAAARSLMPIDPPLGRQTLLHALEAANQAGPHDLDELRAVATEILPSAKATLTVVDRLLFGLLHRFDGEDRQAAPLLREAISELMDETVPEDLRLRWLRLGTFAASELLDEESRTKLITEHASLARRRGALMALPLALVAVGDVHLREGRFALADDANAEARHLAEATGNAGFPGQANLPDLALLCWRGDEEKARAIAAEVTEDMVGRDSRRSISLVRSRLAVLEIGLGNYREALGHAQHVFGEDPLAWGTWVLPELVEAAVRCDEPDVARQAVDRLAARAQAGGAPLGLGLLARSRALLEENANTEGLYQEALALLDSTRAAVYLARTHLVYGEWLRRRRRRRDAREQLRRAYEMLVDIGADAFARRALTELNATGEHVHQRGVDTADALTPQEAHIARLVGEGYQNRDIASQLFISPATVDYHLRKVYRKLGVTSRSQLTRTMMATETANPEAV